jgi:hypothetical protein
MVPIYTFEIEPGGDGKPCMSRESASPLQDHALRLLLLVTPVQGECGPGCVLEHLTDAFIGPGGALEVPVGVDLLANFLTL